MSEHLTVEIYDRAYKDLEKLPYSVREQILNDIEALETTPWPSPPIVKKIKTNLYRLRSGSYRVIFERHQKTVHIMRIVDRKELERILQRLF